jgi:hypothetical protein
MRESDLTAGSRRRFLIAEEQHQMIHESVLDLLALLVLSGWEVDAVDFGGLPSFGDPCCLLPL